MIDLSALMWVLSIFFAISGWNRGWRRELIVTAGIVLALFALFQFDTLLRGTLLTGVGRSEVVIIQMLIFAGIVFFAYQTRTVFGNELRSGRVSDGRADYQNSVLGAIVGFLNGYLIWGTLWYFIDINEYPMAPYIVAPAPNSPAAAAQSYLPLVILGGTNGNGDLLAGAVILLFVIVLVVI